MSNLSLMEVFTTQIASALAVFNDDTSTKEEREREFSDLLGAAMLLGDSGIEAEITELDITATDTVIGKLTALLSLLRPAPTTTGAATGAADSLEQVVADASSSVKHKSPPGDSSPTQVNKRPPRQSRRFDTEEHIALINFFREEADECLTRMSELLLETTDIKPSDEILHELMRHTHSLKGSAGTVELPAIAELTHEYENAVTKIYDDQWRWSTRLRDRLVEASDGIRSIVAEAENPDTETAHVGYWLNRLRNLDTADTAVGVSPDAPANLAFDSAPSSPTSPVQAPPLLVTGDSSDTYSERRRPDRRGMESPLLRVDPARIDQLMNTVGELVFDRTRIEKGVRKLESQLERLQKALDTLGGERSDWAENRRDIDVDEVGTLLSDLESTLRESLPTIGGAIQSLKHDTSLLRRTEFALQDGLTAVRMQSVRGLFQRLSPQLRSIASQANKQVRLVTSGGETEFDKVVADQLIDPIIQLLRNAVAHAIESPDLRVARGKSPEGRIYVTARHEGNVVVLEVSDDGNGVDILALRDRFSASGKWTKEQAERASDAQVLAQIFEPGFSSSTNVDELSGRGVGLSLVRETVTRLGGEVLVSSIPGRGTTFTMRLPLTTAMVNAILFKVGGHVFAIPSVHVLSQSTLDCPLKPTAIDRDGESLPVVSLHETLDFELAPDKDECPAIFLEYLGKRLAISCDKIIGAREIVLQNLGQMLSGIPLYSGGTISPSGKVQLILDPAALVKIAYPADVHNDAEPPQNSGVAERVLVVDDSKVIREAMRRMLGRAGYEVITASDGLSAWHSLLEHRCDAVVTDLEMPGESGFEFLERLQADPRYQHLPKLVISSKANQQNCERAQSLGVSCIIPKPVDQAQLVDALRNARKAKS